MTTLDRSRAFCLRILVASLVSAVIPAKPAGAQTASPMVSYVYKGHGFSPVDVNTGTGTGSIGPIPFGFDFLTNGVLTGFEDFSVPSATQLSGKVILTQPLPPNLTFASPSPSTIQWFSFTDGRSTITSENVIPGTIGNTATPFFAVSTDSNGKITAWEIFIEGPATLSVTDLALASSSGAASGIESISQPTVTFAITSTSQGGGDLEQFGQLSATFSDGVTRLSNNDASNSNASPGIWDTATYQATLLDPVPTLLAGAAVTQDIQALENQTATQVQGLAADGASQIVVQVQISGELPEQVNLTLLDDQNQPSTNATSDGTLTMIDSGLVDPQSAEVFAVYQAPEDFVRVGNTTDAAATTRNVYIKFPDGTTSPIVVVRPPVILIHGLWSAPDAWSNFTPLVTDSRFFVVEADYSGQAGESVAVNAPFILTNMVGDLDAFKTSQNVAATRFDVVAHSMGGLITRAMVLSPNFLANANYNLGLVHKLITIDTPHTGSQFAESLLGASSFCQTVLAAVGKPVAGAIDDLAPGSALLDSLNTPNTLLKAHAVVGVANSAQQVASEQEFSGVFSLSRFASNVAYCSNLIPAGGFSELFGGPSDLVVSQASQAPTTIFTTTASISTQPSTIHTLIPFLFPLGPDALNNGPGGQGNPGLVIDLLNTPVSDPAFVGILP